MQTVATVVVPALDAAGTIEQQLRALQRSSRADDLEVIVADNGSRDGTPSVVEAFAAEWPRVRVVDASTVPGAAHARNVGVDASESELVLLCDADDVVDREWAAGLLDGLQRADLVAGSTVAWRADTHAAPPEDDATPAGPGFGGLGFLPVVIGSSFGVRRAVWQAVGGLDEDLVCGEDFDFAFRVQLAGYRYASRPDAFVHYRMPTSIRAAMRKYYAYGRCAPHLYRKFRAQGMPRRSLLDVAKVWLRFGLRAPELLGTRDDRLRWCERVAHASGRVAGSVELRTWFP
jgi:glycosyltransferase involved in cell wall biosynthesis